MTLLLMKFQIARLKQGPLSDKSVHPESRPEGVELTEKV